MWMQNIRVPIVSIDSPKYLKICSVDTAISIVSFNAAEAENYKE